MNGPCLTRFASAAVAAAALLLCLSACTTLDHFQVYEVVKVPAEHKVRLSDQLNLPLADALLEAQTHFANPTRKLHAGNEVGIQHTNHHLSWYTLAAQQPPEPRRTIRFRNQFGQHSIDTGDDRYLLVPTQKTSDPNSEFPADLDHYRCYEVVQVNTAPALPVVQLGDQFGTVQNLQVGPPVLFCPPVRKVREGENPVGIQNADDHLAIYELPPQPVEIGISVTDQFGERDLQVIRRVFLAVPSEKQVVVVHD